MTLPPDESFMKVIKLSLKSGKLRDESNNRIL